MICQQGLEYIDLPKMGVPWVWHLTAFDNAPVLEIWRMWSTPSLPLFLDSLWSRVVVTVRFPLKDQIDLFKNYLYPFEWCAPPQKKPLKQLYKKIKWMKFPIISAYNNLTQFDMLLKSIIEYYLLQVYRFGILFVS